MSWNCQLQPYFFMVYYLPECESKFNYNKFIFYSHAQTSVWLWIDFHGADQEEAPHLHSYMQHSSNIHHPHVTIKTDKRWAKNSDSASQCTYQKSPTLIPINLLFRLATLFARCLNTVTWDVMPIMSVIIERGMAICFNLFKQRLYPNKIWNAAFMWRV